MSIELPVDYQLSLSEDYMNPMQIEYFRRKLLQSRTDLQRELEAIPHIEPNQTGDQTDQASAAADPFVRCRQPCSDPEYAASNRAGACQARKRHLRVLRGYW
jgi:hypothetical protein